jgi:hypothetical protein
MSFCRRVIPDNFVTMNPSLKEIDKLPVELIQQFRVTKRSAAIPEYLQRYILHLDKASELFNLKGNIADICKELQLAFPDDDLSFSTAKNRVFDAINFFHLNNTVRNEAWDHYYADRLEALGKKAEDAYDADSDKFSGNIQEARRCYERAHALRTKKDENAVDPELLKPKDFLINPDTTAERLGLKAKNLKVLWSDSASFIQKLELGNDVKNSLLHEVAEVTDIDYEDIRD